MNELRIGNRTFRPITADPEPRKPSLRQLIEAKYGTQKAAAEKWGVQRQAVCQWVQGKRKVPQWVLEEFTNGVD